MLKYPQKNFKIKELMLTSDKLSAFDNMGVWMVNGDFKSCKKKKRKKKGQQKRRRLVNQPQRSGFQYKMDFITSSVGEIISTTAININREPEIQKMNIVLNQTMCWDSESNMD